MILRIFVQESPDSELRLKRYEGKKFRGRNWNFGELLQYISKHGMLEGLMCKVSGNRIFNELFCKRKPRGTSPRVRGLGAPLVHHAPGVATLGRTAVGHRRLTGIGLQWPGDHRGLAGSERENWGTRLRRRLGAGSPELAGRWR
jgi:hypothetical protein